MLNTRRLAKEIYALNEEMKQLESKRASFYGIYIRVFNKSY